ncbi:DUF2089 family protein [Vagococcus vulneris]|uniref:DUF2089 domain-containing protein n=1 Tax=Vagococcus vulneris TaxID=1977869 RepID=A0A430A2R3_9ENTE|nr:DUF2089 family protein [Vagococcus vulneris]RSU00697.1 hypothetical protein CBF37_01410 [Vagococcus vulneris]
MDWFLELDSEEQVFIKKFLMASRSLKNLASEYHVSYLTVRLRLDCLIEKIKISDSKKDSFEIKIMQMVIEEKITFDIAKEILKNYKENSYD